jgi:5-methyltetrahydropteroyltriglutamate--homocysteine methyltransferase
VKAYVPGIYARSEELVQATRDLDRGRTTKEAVEEQIARDEGTLVAAQEEVGLDLLSDGMLRWQDLFRPLADAAEGLEARPLTRFLDTNTFYRALIVEGRPHLPRPVPAPSLPEGRWLGTLPSPLALARAADGAASAQELAAGVLGPQIEVWAQAGAALIVLSDPFLARSGGTEQLAQALEELPGDVPFALQLPFGDASPVLELLADASVQAIGVDFYATSLESVPEGYPKEIAAGVVDARSSAPEDPDEIAAFVARLRERKPAGISLVPNGDLQFVPERIAREKIACLGRARAVVGEEVAAS